LNNAAGKQFLPEWPLKLLAILKTSRLLVAGSVPGGVANFKQQAFFFLRIAPVGAQP
jgi:hypothetical protein